MGQRLPIGIQGFVGLRNDQYLYVDKTEYIYQLVHTGKEYFLSRPRRFGKSLLLSALKAYWEGRKDLFKDLRIEYLEKDHPEAWKVHPVFYFDFNGISYLTKGALEEVLAIQLGRWETQYNLRGTGKSLGERFQNLLIEANRVTGLRSIILIDEYDKPLLDTAEDADLQNHNKELFRGFFSILKSFDEYIGFVFITGVTKFHKISIFSDLNQLKDISLTKAYAGICGITEEEIAEYFQEDMRELAANQGISEDECRQELQRTYDGYHFHPEGEGVYNPFSLFNAFADEEFGSFWFETGTPGFLVKKLRESHFDLRKLTDRTLYASEGMLKDYTGEGQDLVPLLYQTGYLTIADYDRTKKRYTLCFPNEEVKYGFLESLIPSYIPDVTAGNGLDIFTLDEYVEKGDLDGIRNILTALFARITYTKETDLFEHYFQSVIYLVFTLLGKFAECEMHTFSGRIDCRVETKKYVYLFEFKRDQTALEALKQINEKEYTLPYAADQRIVYKIGVSFDSAQRKLSGWEVQKQQANN